MASVPLINGGDWNGQRFSSVRFGLVWFSFTVRFSFKFFMWFPQSPGFLSLSLKELIQHVSLIRSDSACVFIRWFMSHLLAWSLALLQWYPGSRSFNHATGLSIGTLGLDVKRSIESREPTCLLSTICVFRATCPWAHRWIVCLIWKQYIE
jgi:hypothetical protein